MSVRVSVEVQEESEYWTVIEQLIVDGHTPSSTTHKFPKTKDGYVLIPIYPRSRQYSKAVMIRNVSLHADGGKVFVESTENYPSLKAELDFFCRSWYRQWVLEKEGKLV